MANIVSVLELQDYMSGIDLSVRYGQENAAELVLAGVQSEIETYLGRPISPTTVTETLAYEDFWAYRLAEPRITPVISVSVPTDWAVVNGRLVPPFNGWYGSILEYIPSPGYAVTYVGGLDGANIPELKLMVLRVAAREMSNKHDDTVGLNAGDLTRSKVDVVPEGLNDDDRKRLDRFRRRMVV